MKDLTGQRFGRLIAVKPTEERRNRCVMWLCKCDCGQEILVRASELIRGHTKSCGCLCRKQPFKDLAGQQFGRLLALEPTNRRQGHGVVWKCKCICGNTAYVASHSLVSGSTKSCGCLNRELASE